MQHLLARARWDAEAVRDDLREYVVAHLGDGDGVLVADETGDVKKGSATVGVQRQYTGTAGRIENAQVGVYLGYAGRAGHALIDRALYMPRCWIDDRDRCAAAGVPDEVEFATKPQLARAMITRALDAGTPAAWVAADEVYGADPGLRTELETRGVGYVLAIGCNRRVPTSVGAVRADEVAARLPARAWQRLSAGEGAKGHRYYDWALADLDNAHEPGCRQLLIRRNRRAGEPAYYRCYSPRPVSLATLVRTAGRRWTIEQSFQNGKGLTGLDQHQTRRWASWHRWVTLAMLAQTFLAVLAATQRPRSPAPSGRTPLTANEIRHLLTVLINQPPSGLSHRLRWSAWKRRHQHRARICHYQRQAIREP